MTQSVPAGKLTRLAIDIAKRAFTDAEREFAITVREIVYETAERDGAGFPSEGWMLNVDTYTWTQTASSATSQVDAQG